MKRRQSIWLGAVLAAFAFGCGGGDQVTETTEVVRVELHADKDTIDIGEKLPLEVRAYTGKGTLVPNPKATFTSSAPEVASVDDDGVVHGVRAGSAIVTAEVSGKKGTMSVSVQDPIHSIEIEPNPVEMLTQEEVQLTAIAYDASGNPLEGRTFEWEVENDRVATVDENGLLRSLRREEETKVFARSGGVEGQAVVIVTKRVASIEIRPEAPMVREKSTLQLEAIVRDDGGLHLDRPVEWSSADPEIATVDQTGLVLGVKPGMVEISASSGGVTGTVELEVRPERVHRIEIVPSHVELVVGETQQYTVRLYNQAGEELFDRPLLWSVREPSVVDQTYVQNAAPVDENGLLRAVRPVDGIVKVQVEGDAVHAEATFRIVLRMDAVAAGQHHTCALTAGGEAWCWGENEFGETGRPPSLDVLPAPVETDLRFRAIAAGSKHTCAVTEEGEAWCWGRNDFGQLGDGSTQDAIAPRKVVEIAGVTGFESIYAGAEYTCAIDRNHDAYCWGRNHDGRLGNGRRDDSTIPEKVTVAADGSGPVQFKMLALGKNTSSTMNNLTCGLSLANEAFCWGENDVSSYGIGAGPSPLLSAEPVRVAGGHSFQSLTVGRDHVCAVTLDNEAYCWGAGGFGQLGDDADGVGHHRLEPHPVETEERYVYVGAGDSRTCALTTDGALDCWGARFGLPVPWKVPTRIGQDGAWVFETIATGDRHACGIDASKVVYCWGANVNSQLGNVSGAVFVDEPTPVFPEDGF